MERKYLSVMFEDVVNFAKKLEADTKMSMVFCAMFLFLPQLVLWFPPMANQVAWVLGCYVLLVPCFPRVVKYWCLETTVMYKFWSIFFPFTNVKVEVEGASDTALKILDRDVTAKAARLIGEGVMTQTVSRCPFWYYMAYMSYAIKQTEFYTNEGMEVNGLKNWSAKTLIVMNSKKRISLCIKIAILAVFYAPSYWSELEPLLNVPLEMLRAYQKTESNSGSSTSNTNLMFTCIKSGVCKPGEASA